MQLNKIWKQYLKDNGVDFVYFIDTSAFPTDVVNGYTCVVLFGKALSKDYINTLKADKKPKQQEFANTERKMDALAEKLVNLLETEGYKSISKLKFARLPHKTVALRAGLGFIGKNNLLINDQYGCALVLGKVLTTTPFVTIKGVSPKKPKCAKCKICVDVCPTKALYGKTWSITTSRDEIMVRKLCCCCLKCMIWCPYTVKYAKAYLI
jgi:epoxyqueuosine reductase QueG